ncbi:hypothetical protein A3D42_01270 [Candidatus Nomurabacteria bacterium RIFCSPHIGHO2_02_FULL_41_18]|uniref:DUF378 domain-containing protein n=1 Tax=Candidatus Nomurabacteria bacterium RIFCSPHIGHO2_02_FULL_41_18 TaxID=1801754 RepID=A0A1F6W7S4_9BACT|nr:MAG: hypothetical protein A2737_00020 [Candidatus Nomurabacteria bacterium RIFCSPHIGHO2_01_FULL_41_71]OGI77826.1 MAG: hypothetical protein A3D42_01270 [Candidatus Nomurabacteria bacterium RIFCSPHIGHO2_02_FULL_41_18]OGI89976.1 MAG: hypothetical protein A3B01_01920 [Candidatus Nomurabacteria bacterium RIFCSPLOWO2_01_FULL_41_52b]OGJ00488.1 MAG: hypothetical protein A3I90_00510 [Candidatus Nomurabacteria bacterium RIFCSPLOWO2_02_FULL_41_9]
MGGIFWVGKVLLIVGGLNWGLVGLGALLGSMESWNVINMLLGSVPVLESIVYILVGVAAVKKIFMSHWGRCRGCKDGVCTVCMDEKAQGSVQ